MSNQFRISLAYAMFFIAGLIVAIYELRLVLVGFDTLQQSVGYVFLSIPVAFFGLTGIILSFSVSQEKTLIFLSVITLILFFLYYAGAADRGMHVFAILYAVLCMLGPFVNYLLKSVVARGGSNSD